MYKLLPKWLMKKYLLLWDSFNDSKEFTFMDATKVLKDDDSRIISIAFSELRKAGWLTSKLHPNDARKRIYNLNPYEEIFDGVVKELKKRR